MMFVCHICRFRLKFCGVNQIGEASKITQIGLLNIYLYTLWSLNY
jgi:hypothetical protein